MTDKIQQARRAAFEKWAERHRMPIGRDGAVVDYSSRATDACWMAFNAALDCVVIELGKGALASDGHEWMPVSAFRAAIESTNLGIKVK